MTEEQALAKAQELWGPSGMVFDRSSCPNDFLIQDAAKRVGMYWVGLDSFTYGNGDTWENAFANVKSGRAK